MRVQRAKFSTNWTSPAHIMWSWNQPVTLKKKKKETFPVGWTMSVGYEDKPTKWLQREGQNMLSITIIQEPLDLRFLRINFQHCENNVNFRGEFGVWLWKRKQRDFSQKGGGGRGTRTPQDPLDIDSPTLASSRLSDRGDGAKRYEQLKKQRSLHYYYYYYYYYYKIKTKLYS